MLIYNISMINIRERVNEFGTLLVLGMSEKEISGFLAVEQGFYFILGILAGIPGSRGIKTLVEKGVISDSYSIDMHVSIWSYMRAFFICLAITALAGRGEMRFVRNIRLTEVLKEKGVGMKKIVKIITDKWKGWKYRKAASAAAVVVLIGAGIMVYQGRTRAVECARAAIQDVEDYYTEDGVISLVKSIASFLRLMVR